MHGNQPCWTDVANELAPAVQATVDIVDTATVEIAGTAAELAVVVAEFAVVVAEFVAVAAEFVAVGVLVGSVATKPDPHLEQEQLQLLGRQYHRQHHSSHPSEWSRSANVRRLKSAQRFPLDRSIHLQKTHHRLPDTDKPKQVVQG